MKYLLVGRRAAEKVAFKKFLSESCPNDEFEICENVKTLIKPPNTRIIYINVNIGRAWDWEFSGQLDIHTDNTAFYDEVMDFREFDENLADIKVSFDCAQITCTVQEIVRKIGELNEQNDCSN